MTTPKSAELDLRGRSRRTMQRKSKRLNKIQKFDVDTMVRKKFDGQQPFGNRLGSKPADLDMNAELEKLIKAESENHNQKFDVGTMVRKKFDGEFYMGKVVKVVKDVWRSLSTRDPEEVVFFPVMYKIKYSDGDREEMDEKEVEEHLFELTGTEDQSIRRDVNTRPNEQPVNPSRNARNLTENGNQDDDRHQHHEEIVHGGPSMVTRLDYAQDSSYRDIKYHYRWFIRNAGNLNESGNQDDDRHQHHEVIVHSGPSMVTRRDYAQDSSYRDIKYHYRWFIDNEDPDSNGYKNTKLAQTNESLVLVPDAIILNDPPGNPEKKLVPKAKLDNLSDHLNDENQQPVGNRPGSKPADLDMKAKLEKLIEAFDGLGLNPPLSDSSSSDEDNPEKRDRIEEDHEANMEKERDTIRNRHNDEKKHVWDATLENQERSSSSSTTQRRRVVNEDFEERKEANKRVEHAKPNSIQDLDDSRKKAQSWAVISENNELKVQRLQDEIGKLRLQLLVLARETIDSPQISDGEHSCSFPSSIFVEESTPPVDEEAEEEKEASIPNDKEVSQDDTSTRNNSDTSLSLNSSLDSSRYSYGASNGTSSSNSPSSSDEIIWREPLPLVFERSLPSVIFVPVVEPQQLKPKLTLEESREKRTWLTSQRAEYMRILQAERQVEGQDEKEHQELHKLGGRAQETTREEERQDDATPRCKTFSDLMRYF